jgi:signal transduction histidine kinase
VAENSGKGMGLSIVRRLGERFGWPVELSSTLGQGTVATIRFASPK